MHWLVTYLYCCYFLAKDWDAQPIFVILLSTNFFYLVLLWPKIIYDSFRLEISARKMLSYPIYWSILTTLTKVCSCSNLKFQLEFHYLFIERSRMNVLMQFG